MIGRKHTGCLACGCGRKVCAAQVPCAKVSCVASFAISWINIVIVRKRRLTNQYGYEWKDHECFVQQSRVEGG